jgi:hypothetical protein
MATEVYFTAKQSYNPVGSSHWFTFPQELQETVDRVVFMHTDSEEPEIRALANDVYQDEDSDYSDRMWLRCGSRLYVLYRRQGEYRVASGFDHSGDASVMWPFDKDEIIAHFAAYAE